MILNCKLLTDCGVVKEVEKGRMNLKTFQHLKVFDWAYHLPIKSNKLIFCERIFFHSAAPNPSLGFVFGLDKSITVV